MATKVISIRVEEDVLKDFDELVSKTQWWKRNNLIEGLMRMAVTQFDVKTAVSVARFYPEFGDVVDEFTFKYHRSHK